MTDTHGVARDQLRSFVERIESPASREVWMPVLGYEGLYEASNHGRVRRAPEAPARSMGLPGKIITPAPTERGYLRLSLSRGGETKSYPVHRIVLSAFCGPPPFPGAHAAHNDGNPSNNALTNLRWATAVENQKDVERHGNRTRGSDIHNAKLTDALVEEIRARIASKERYPTIAKDYGVSISTVSLIKRNRIWKHVNATG